MATLNKRQLLHVVENAVLDSGWNFVRLTQGGAHPANYQIYRGDRDHSVCVYIWNLTHGGGPARPADEYRIQITGISQFEPGRGEKALILGWWDEADVFAGFDYHHHARWLGHSPSMQIREPALRAAHVHGFAPHRRGQDEIAIAFRSDFMGPYIDNLEALHACGEVTTEVELLERVGEDPDSVPETAIEESVSEPRRYAVTSTRRAVRENGFRDRVLTAYRHQCAMCGTQLRLVEGAHIVPAVYPGSTDETCNGVALCTLHHRAYDRALVTFDADFRTHVNDAQAAELESIGRDSGLREFRGRLRPILILPPDRRDRPKAVYVQTANALRGWLGQ